MKKMRKNGFTLVELMVVAVIVAILAAVAIPLMSGNKKRAMCSEAEAALGTIRSQLRAQYAETKDYTKSASGGTVAGVFDISGVETNDLQGRYFAPGDYSITVGSSTYTVSCTGTGEVAGVTITLDQDGTFTRTGI